MTGPTTATTTTTAPTGTGLWRRQAVAVAVLVWVAICGVAAIPDVGRANGNWNDPRVNDELTSWAKALGLPPSAFKRSLQTVVDDLVGVRRLVMKPFRPLLDATGVRQSWVVFVAGTRQADRFEVVGFRDDGTVVDLYRRGDDTAQHDATLIEGSRFRNATFLAAWPDQRGKRWRRRVCDIVARRAFANDDALTSVRCSFLRRRNVKPGEGPIPDETRTLAVTVRRDGSTAPAAAVTP